MQTNLNFDFPENIFTPGTHNYILFEHLKRHREITTKEIHNVLHVETARLRSDIRPHLRKNGYDYIVKTIPGENGNRLYKIV